ncbi:MAG: nucleotidyltransferase domain-containing protein [Patescibacteria group bacterium]
MNKKLKKIIETCDPESIFLYGSRARGDSLPSSDTEIGVLTNKDHPRFDSVFFFSYKDFKNSQIDTPFPTDIYLRELSLSAKTLYGEEVVENFTPPPVTTISLLERINFDCATALYGAKLKNKELFYKSVLFGVRNLIILKNKDFPLTYEDIYKEAENLDLKEFDSLPKIAFATRIKNKKISKKQFRKAITFTNYLIRKEIKKQDKKVILK